MDWLHGDWYNFWSGIGNDLPIWFIGIVPMFIAWYRKNECHQRHCHRLGHHPYKHYHYCAKHHPIENGSQYE